MENIVRLRPDETDVKCRCVDLPHAGGGRSGMEDWAVDGRPKGVTEERLTPKRSVGRNVHPASLRGEGISLAVHDGGWQAC